MRACSCVGKHCRGRLVRCVSLGVLSLSLPGAIHANTCTHLSNSFLWNHSGIFVILQYVLAVVTTDMLSCLCDLHTGPSLSRDIDIFQ